MVDDAIRFVAGHQNQNQTKEEDKDENKKYNKHDNKDKVINEFETETLNSTDLNDLTSKQETSVATEATPTSLGVSIVLRGVIASDIVKFVCFLRFS